MINPELELEAEIFAVKNGFLARWKVPKELRYLDGHFPDFPVVPAAAIIDVTLEALRRALSLPGIRLQTLENAKFMELVQPGQTMDIRYEQTTDPARWNAKWKAESLVADLTFRLDLSG